MDVNTLNAFGPRQEEVAKTIVLMKSKDLKERPIDAYHLNIAFAGHRDAITITLQLEARTPPAYTAKPVSLSCNSETCSQYLRALIGLGATHGFLDLDDGSRMMKKADVVKNMDPPKTKAPKKRFHYVPQVKKNVPAAVSAEAADTGKPMSDAAVSTAPLTEPVPAHAASLPPTELPPPEVQPGGGTVPTTGAPSADAVSTDVPRVRVCAITKEPTTEAAPPVPAAPPVAFPMIDPLKDFKAQAQTIPYGSRVKGITIRAPFDSSRDASVSVLYVTLTGSYGTLSCYVSNLREPGIRKSDPLTPKKDLVIEIASALTKATGHPAKDLRQMMEAPSLSAGIDPR